MEKLVFIKALWDGNHNFLPLYDIFLHRQRIFEKKELIFDIAQLLLYPASSSQKITKKCFSLK